MSDEKQTIEVLLQKAVTSLNELIVCDDLSKNYKAIIKISRFKDWLREAVASKPIEVTPEAENTNNEQQTVIDFTE